MRLPCIKMWVDKMRENASRGNSDGGAGDYGPNSGGYAGE